MSVTNLSQAIFDQVSERVLHWRYLPGERLHRRILVRRIQGQPQPRARGAPDADRSATG